MQSDAKAVEALLADGVDANAIRVGTEQDARQHALPRRLNWSVLMYAVERGDKQIIDLLLDAGADVNHSGRGNAGVHTPLSLAAKHGRAEILATLLSKGAKLAKPQAMGETELMLAARGGHVDVIGLLLDAGAVVKARGDKHRTALMSAASGGSKQAVAKLLEAGAQINAQAGNGQTALMYAASYGGPEVVSLLLEAGADVHAVDSGRRTVLMFGTKHPEVLRLLLKAGAKVNAQSEYGRTALMSAARGSKEDALEAVDLLLEAGAEVDAKARQKETALIYALDQTGPNMAVVKRLIEAGADVNTVTHGQSPLMAAVRSRRVEPIKLLLEKGAKVDTQDQKGRTALIFAMQSTYFEQPREAGAVLLLEAGADVNLADKRGWTPLMYAVHHSAKYTGVIKLLLDQGAKVDAVNEDKQTALQLAGKYESAETAKLLRNFEK